MCTTVTVFLSHTWQNKLDVLIDESEQGLFFFLHTFSLLLTGNCILRPIPLTGKVRRILDCLPKAPFRASWIQYRRASETAWDVDKVVSELSRRRVRLSVCDQLQNGGWRHVEGGWGQEEVMESLTEKKNAPERMTHTVLREGHRCVCVCVRGREREREEKTEEWRSKKSKL